MPSCHGPEASGRVRVPSGPQKAWFLSGFFVSMYTVYILESIQFGTYYIGYTDSISRRLEEHNAGLSRFTASKRPWKLVYTEVFELKSDAIKREIFLKKQR